MPKTLDITRILREQKEQLRAGFQDSCPSENIVAVRRSFRSYGFLFSLHASKNDT